MVVAEGMSERDAKERLIVALDYPTLDEARAAATQLAAEVGVFKIGLELYVGHGPEAVGLGEEFARPVFLDLKLHDIPATVGRAVRRAATLGVRFLTVHASGGRAMLQAAVKEARTADSPMDIVAVTVLTSLDRSDLEDVGVSEAPAKQAKQAAQGKRATSSRAARKLQKVLNRQSFGDVVVQPKT